MDFDGPVPGMPGATIRRVAELPTELAGGRRFGARGQARPGAVLLDIPDVGRFLAQDGTRIDYAPAADADPGLVFLYLNGSARGALIHQRGELPLHAATLIPPGGGGALAICGDSGAGKSTLAAELSRRGWLLVADDTTRLTHTDSGIMAWPSRDSIKLWRDSCERLAIDPMPLKRVASTMDKYYWHVPACHEAVPLASVVELLPAERGHAHLTPADGLGLLTRHTYRRRQIPALEKTADFARMIGAVVKHCRLFQLSQTRSMSLPALADSVEESALAA